MEVFLPNRNASICFILVYVEVPVEYRMRVFTRRGELVFETQEVYRGWDGYIHQEQAPGDVYVWMVEGKMGEWSTLQLSRRCYSGSEQILVIAQECYFCIAVKLPKPTKEQQVLFNILKGNIPPIWRGLILIHYLICSKGTDCLILQVISSLIDRRGERKVEANHQESNLKITSADSSIESVC